MFFSNNFSYPFGLDISDLSLKLVQLNKAGGHRLGRTSKIKIQALGKVSLPAGLIINGEIKNQEEVSKFIRELVNNPKYGKVSSDSVVACLPETKTFIKLIEIEKTPNDLSNIIEAEIEKHVPMSLNEIYYDWQIIEDRNDTQMILIGVASKKIVNQYTDLLDKAKLSVEALEIEPVALCRSLLSEESPNFKGPFDENYAIIDVGASRTSLVVYSKNTILFTIRMPLSGEKITENISKSLNIKKKQAEKAKIICGLDKSRAQGIINRVLSGMIGELNEKINEVLNFYSDHFSDRGPINRILLCGGGANIIGIETIVSQAVSINVRGGDPLVNLGDMKESRILKNKLLLETHKLDIDFSKNIKSKKKNTLSVTQSSDLTFATAIGLALRGIFIDKL